MKRCIFLSSVLFLSVSARRIKYPVVKSWTKFGESDASAPSNHQVGRRNVDGPQPSYGASSPSGAVDLHNKEFCVDVSTYQPVVWEEKDGEVCDTVFVKKCEEKSENVCADVTETRCQVKATYTGLKFSPPMIDLLKSYSKRL